MGDLAAQLRVARQKGAMTTRRAEQLEQDVGKLERENAELRTTRAKILEPRTYERGNGHSWILDQAMVALNRGDADGGVKAARARLERHAAEVMAEMPARLAERDRDARDATERAATRSRAEMRAYERFSGAGGRVFEQRALTRVDGQGGFIAVPPVWLTDEYIPYALAGRNFLNLWTQLPLPPRTDQLNLPRVTLGLATGNQAADIAPLANRDLTDSFGQAVVRTVGGFVDLPLVWLDQRPGDADATLLPMLLEDYNTQLNGLALLGSSTLGQPNGIGPAGNIGSANMVNLQNTNNAASQQWNNGGSGIAGSPHYLSAQLFSKLSTLRAVRPTAWVVNELVWAVICEAADSQVRPIVPPEQGAPRGDGTAIGALHGLPVITDPNVPVTFSSTAGGAPANPVMSAVTAGQVAPAAGTGTYTPVFCGKWDDCFMWEGEPQLHVFREVDAGPLNARVRMHNYVALLPGRFTWGGSNQTFSGTNQGGGVNNGAAVSYGALTQMVTNSVLQSGTGN